MRVFALAVTLILLAVPAMAQEIKPTTAEEYNYGVVGYKIQLQAKLGDKEGYHMKDAQGCEEEDRKIEYKLLYRNGENSPCEVIMIFTRWRNPPMYYCIPTRNADPDLWSKFNRALLIGTDNPADQLQFFTSCLARLMMDMASKK